MTTNRTIAWLLSGAFLALAVTSMNLPVMVIASVVCIAVSCVK